MRLALIIVSLLLVLVACTTTKEFQNNYIEHHRKGVFEFLSMRYFGELEWPDYQAQAPQVPRVKANLDLIHSPNSSALLATWLGHSTFLIQYKGVNVLTDPVFSDYASPVSFAGPKRYTPVAMDINSLPAIDVVVISHNHYDHLDVDSIEALPATTVFYVPENLSSWFINNGIAQSHVHELKWWEKHDRDSFRITATPSQHWSARTPFDRFKTHWASWRIEIEDKSIWFAGDTGYNDKDFKRIGEETGAVDLALIPIGAYAPRDFMRLYHVNVDEAEKIHEDVKSRFSIGMHWGTFPLTAEPVMEPANRLKAKQRDDFVTISLGQSIQL